MRASVVLTKYQRLLNQVVAYLAKLVAGTVNVIA